MAAAGIGIEDQAEGYRLSTKLLPDVYEVAVGLVNISLCDFDRTMDFACGKDGQGACGHAQAQHKPPVRAGGHGNLTGKVRLNTTCKRLSHGKEAIFEAVIRTESPVLVQTDAEV